MGSFKIRTDLALEARESVEEGAKALSGVTVDEDYHEDSEVRITKVVITSKNSAKFLVSLWEHTLHWKHLPWHCLMRIIIKKFPKNLQSN